MKITGQHELDLDRNTLWEKITDHEILKQCIPGCERFDQNGDNQFEITILAKVGPIKTRFNGQMSMVDIQSPVSYKLVGTGSGGSAGSAKGEALITLDDVGNNKTVLNYDATVSVSGRLAQIGVKLVDGTARHFATRFFSSFADLVKSGSASEDNIMEGSPKPEAFSVDAPTGLNARSKLFAVTLVLLVIAGLIVFGFN